MARQTCTHFKPGWVCLRDAGHDGPCAAAPVSAAAMRNCTDVDVCIALGCRGQCGPAAKPSLWRRFCSWIAASLMLAPCAEDCGSPCCHYGCENVMGHRWPQPCQHDGAVLYSDPPRCAKCREVMPGSASKAWPGDPRPVVDGQGMYVGMTYL